MVQHRRSIWVALCGITAALALTLPQTVSGEEPDTRVTEDQCHGKPHWCLKVSNQTDTTVKVFVDGDDVWRMAPGEVDWFPLTEGEHQVNVCMLFVFSSDKCLSPDTVKANSDYLLVVYPQ